MTKKDLLNILQNISIKEAENPYVRIITPKSLEAALFLERYSIEPKVLDWWVFWAEIGSVRSVRLEFPDVIFRAISEKIHGPKEDLESAFYARLKLEEFYKAI